MEVTFPGFDLFWSLVLAFCGTISLSAFVARRNWIAADKREAFGGGLAIMVPGFIVSVVLLICSVIAGSSKYGDYYNDFPQQPQPELTISYETQEGLPPTIRVNSPGGFSCNDLEALKLILENQ